MSNDFFAQLEDSAVRALLSRTALRDTALLLVSPTLHIVHCNEQAAALTELHPMQRIDQLLSEAAARALRDCVENHVARTVTEELDDVFYQLELLPHRDGALMAFLHDNHAGFDGSLRVLHKKSADTLGVLMADAVKVSDPALSAQLINHCMRLKRALNHSDFLHEPPIAEHMDLQYTNLSALCHEAANEILRLTGRSVAVSAPDQYELLVQPDLIRRAIYNLLTNALHATAGGGTVEITVVPDAVNPAIRVTDDGTGLHLAYLETLLEGWQRPCSLQEFLEPERNSLSMGFGLPLVRKIAQLHEGRLLLIPRERGTELRMILSHLPEMRSISNLNAPMILEDNNTIAEMELSVLL